MAMNEAKRQKLIKLDDSANILLRSLADRLPERDLKSLQESSFAGELHLLVEGICGCLIQDQIKITSTERDQLAAVLAMFSRPDASTYRYIADPVGSIEALNVDE